MPDTFASMPKATARIGFMLFLCRHILDKSLDGGIGKWQPCAVPRGRDNARKQASKGKERGTCV